MTRKIWPSVSFVRLGLLICVPLALLIGVRAISWAVNLKTFNSGETLTAADLNANFDEIKTLGYQVQDAQAGSAQTFGASYANVFPSYTFNATSAKTYLVQVDADMYFTTLSGARGSAYFQLLNTTTGATYTFQYGLEGNDTNVRWQGHWSIPVQMVKGNNTLQLQSRNILGTGVTDTSSKRVFTISG